MSGIYIKGMEMPGNCCVCPLFKSTMSKQLFCKAFGAFDRKDYDKLPFERMKNCPLVPVPSHGRLIDADDIRNEIDMARPGRSYEDAWALTIVDNAITVIAADMREESR